MFVRRACVWAFAAVVVLIGGPAWAHVQVEAQPGQPGAVDALLTFTAEAESTTAGITKLEVIADPAVTGDQVSFVEGPPGWNTSLSLLGGFAVAGPALPTGTDAKVTVRVKQLPNAPQVEFKVIQSYSDGKVDRWIEPPGPGGKEPESPAPIVELTAGAESAKSQAPSEEVEHGHLARTGSASRALVLVAGLLLLLGGLGIMGGGTRRHLT